MQKQENEKVLILYPKQPVSLVLFSRCCFSFSLVDHQALEDWLHDMSTLPLDVELLRHAWQLEHLLRKLSLADIVAGEAKYTKCLSAFFRRQSNLRLTNARVKSDTWVLLSLLNCNCLDFEDFRGRIECVSFSIPYFGQLYYSRLKDAGRTDVYVHTSRLGEKILAAGSDFVSTHHGKEVVLVFNKDTREAFSIACNTESDMLHLF